MVQLAIIANGIPKPPLVLAVLVVKVGLQLLLTDSAHALLIIALLILLDGDVSVSLPTQMHTERRRVSNPEAQMVFETRAHRAGENGRA